MPKYTMKQFQEEYPNDAACLAKLMEINYGGDELTCPGCGVEDAKFHAMHGRRAYACQECGHHIYPAAGTIFHKSPTPLTKWFYAMYLMTSTRHGVPAKELERQLGVTYKCAWRMAHELRKLMASADHGGTLGGSETQVEMDETLIGSRQKQSDRRKRGTNKITVFGMVERDGGKIVVGPIPDTTKETVENIIKENVKIGTSINTDEHPTYTHLKDRYRHSVVNHSNKEYVRGDVHTNTIEGHWSLLKRAIAGTHNNVSAKHFWKYAAEFSYRRNYRYSHTAMFDRLVAAFALPRLQES